MHDILVSVVIPMFNAERSIGRTLESVKKQTYTHIELILVDDRSRDCTVEVVERFLEKNPIGKHLFLKNEKNRGVAFSRNRAVRSSSGQFLAFLDSDDVWTPEKLEVQVGFMKKQDLQFSYTSYFSRNSLSPNPKLQNFSVPESVEFTSLLKTCSVFTSTVVLDRAVWPKNGMIDWRARQDYITWLEIARAGTVMRGLNTPLMIYETGGSGISRNKFAVARIQWQVYRQAMGLNILKSGYFFLHYMAFGSVKYLRQQS